MEAAVIDLVANRASGNVDLPFGVRTFWRRHDVENIRKRLKPLEANVVPKGSIVTRRGFEEGRGGQEVRAFDGACRQHREAGGLPSRLATVAHLTAAFPMLPICL